MDYIEPILSVQLKIRPAKQRDGCNVTIIIKSFHNKNCSCLTNCSIRDIFLVIILPDIVNISENRQIMRKKMLLLMDFKCFQTKSNTPSRLYV